MRAEYDEGHSSSFGFVTADLNSKRISTWERACVDLAGAPMLLRIDSAHGLAKTAESPFL